MTPPAKKATPAKANPSLDDLVNDSPPAESNRLNEESQGNEVTVVNPENVDTAEDEHRDLDAEGNPRTVTNNLPRGLAGKDVAIDYPSDGAVNHTWTEDKTDKVGGLATLHPDRTPNPLPLHQSSVSKTVYVTDYANPAELDDKGLVGETPPDEIDNELPDSENDDEEV